jgi:hypothetical protein
VATTFLGNARLNPRARQFYRRAFEPAYKSLRNAANHTPLVVLLWGPPRLWTREQARRRAQIHDALEQLGHTVISDEHLSAAGSTSKKGVEFIPSHTVDLVVAIQPLYRIIGSVRHFVELRVVDSKMLLFVDQVAADHQLYAPALADLIDRYGNVETYDATEDAAKTILLDKIVDQARAMQMVKYRALRQSKSWGLENVAFDVPAPGATAQPFSHNLLELYRAHRDEIDVLIYPISLFILAFTHHVNRITFAELARDIDLTQKELGDALEWLKSAGFLTQTGAEFQTSDLALRLLHSIGLTAPAPKVPAAIPRGTELRRELALSGIAGVALASVILASIAMLNGANVSQNNQPLEFTPVPTSSISIKTAIPTQAVAPTLALNAPSLSAGH